MTTFARKQGKRMWGWGRQGSHSAYFALLPLGTRASIARRERRPSRFKLACTSFSATALGNSSSGKRTPEAVGYVLCCEPDILELFGRCGRDAQDLVYTNWMSLVRQGLLALELYSPEKKAWGQAHCHARYVLTQVLLAAGQDFVVIKETVEVDGAPDVRFLLDRTKIDSVGKPALNAFLRLLQAHKSSGDVAGGKTLFDHYGIPTEQALKWRDICIARRKPRRIIVQPNTRLCPDEGALLLVRGDGWKALFDHYGIPTEQALKWRDICIARRKPRRIIVQPNTCLCPDEGALLLVRGDGWKALFDHYGIPTEQALKWRDICIARRKPRRIIVQPNTRLCPDEGALLLVRGDGWKALFDHYGIPTEQALKWRDICIARRKPRRIIVQPNTRLCPDEGALLLVRGDGWKALFDHYGIPTEQALKWRDICIARRKPRRIIVQPNTRLCPDEGALLLVRGDGWKALFDHYGIPTEQALKWRDICIARRKPRRIIVQPNTRLCPDEGALLLVRGDGWKALFDHYGIPTEQALKWRDICIARRKPRRIIVQPNTRLCPDEGALLLVRGDGWKALFDHYGIPTEQALKWRDICIARRKPRRIIVQPNTRLCPDEGALLLEYPETFSGVVKGWLARVPADTDADLLALAAKDAKHFL